MKNMMKWVALFNTLLLLFLLTGCANRESRPVTYVDEQVTATVTRVEKGSWYAGTRHYQARIWVTDNKYGSTKMYQSYASGMFNLPEHWNYEKGDQITVTVRLEYFADTGQVYRIYIR